MENKFLNGMADETNWKLTENGADALKSTRDALVDLFGTIGALRSRSDSDIEMAFMKAYAADKLLALKMLFYARNIRGGLGERRVFRTILRWMVERNPEHILANFDNIVKFGRWDDMYVLVGTSLEAKAFAFMKAQFSVDLLRLADNKPISLLGKWLKSVNSHVKETRELGLMTSKAFGLSEKQYRKACASLRAALKVTEVYMSKNEWAFIDYAHVPSKAMNNYHGAFMKNDKERFETFLGKVEKGEVTIKAETLYPYDLFEKYTSYSAPNQLDRTIEAQWKALPNYVEGENNFMVMADTSGSMSGRPMATAVGLAIYFAERNHGPYKDKFMTFAAKPRFVNLVGNTLYDKLHCVPWGICENTNIEAAFDLILKVAVDNHLAQADLPKSLIIISDMEFDQAQTYSYSSSGRVKQDYQTLMTKKFAAAGYELPKVVYWNVDARADTFHAKSTTPGVQFISGQSVSAFKSLIKGAEFTAYQLMLETLNDPMYDSVVLG